MVEDLNPEQAFTLDLLVRSGVPNAEAVVRCDRVSAAVVGALLAPVWTEAMDSLTLLVNTAVNRGLLRRPQ